MHSLIILNLSKLDVSLIILGEMIFACLLHKMNKSKYNYLQLKELKESQLESFRLSFLLNVQPILSKRLHFSTVLVILLWKGVGMILRWSYYEVIRVLVICFGTNPIYLHLNGLRMFLKMFFPPPQALHNSPGDKYRQSITASSTKAKWLYYCFVVLSLTGKTFKWLSNAWFNYRLPWKAQYNDTDLMPWEGI